MGNSKETQTITVETASGPVVVRKLTFGDYAEVIRALDKIPGRIMGFVDKKSAEDGGKKPNDYTNSELAMELLPVVADSFPEMARILAVATDKDAGFIMKLDAADVVDVLGAGLELNDIGRIVAAIKKIQALRAGRPKSPLAQS